MMPPRTTDKRERLLDAARDLIHEHGFAKTTLADIAAASGVPLGNVYYYFRTKEDIGAAVIAEHRQRFQGLFEEWNRLPDPLQRLDMFLNLLLGKRDSLAEHGCPLGSLLQELNKADGSLADKAQSPLREQLDWITAQFRSLRQADADDLALQLISTVQGVILLANTLHDASVVERQIARLKVWLRSLPGVAVAAG